MRPRLQATYVPEENAIAWWGVPAAPSALDATGRPPGRRATLRLAGVVGDQVVPVEVQTCLTDLAVAAAALAADAAEDPAGTDALRAIAAMLPPAGHAGRTSQGAACRNRTDDLTVTSE